MKENRKKEEIFTLQTRASSYCKSLIALFFESSTSFKKNTIEVSNYKNERHCYYTRTRQLGTINSWFLADALQIKSSYRSRLRKSTLLLLSVPLQSTRLTSSFLVTTVRAVGSRLDADSTSFSCASCLMKNNLKSLTCYLISETNRRSKEANVVGRTDFSGNQIHYFKKETVAFAGNCQRVCNCILYKFYFRSLQVVFLFIRTSDQYISLSCLSTTAKLANYGLCNGS